MDIVIECALRSVISTRKDLFGEDVATFLHFESNTCEKGSVQGFNSDAIFGCIVYTVNNEVRRSPSLVLKLTPAVKPFPEFHLFSCTNEIFFYVQVLPFFQSLRNIQPLFPKFYGSQVNVNVNSLDAIIVFENLQNEGYIHSEKRSFLDYDHLALMMKKIGQFHAYSYAARKMNERHFLALANSFTENFFTVIGKMPFLIPKSGLKKLNSLMNDTRYSHKIPEIKKLIETSNELATEYMVKDRENPIAVLCHGDYLRGNVLFKYNGKEPMDLKFIDLATCKLASPALDLVLLLYLNADQKMRDEHWDDLINEYYQALKDTFPQMKIPTKNNILQEIKKKAIFSFFVACYFLGKQIAFDNNLPTNILKGRYEEVIYSELPEEMNLYYLDLIGEPLTRIAMSNMLKDMIDRNFI